MQPIAARCSGAPASVGYVCRSGWQGNVDHEVVELLHRVTEVPCATLRDSLERLAASERYQLDTLAHEILFDARISAASAEPRGAQRRGRSW